MSLHKSCIISQSKILLNRTHTQKYIVFVIKIITTKIKIMNMDFLHGTDLWTVIYFIISIHSVMADED